MVVAFYILSSLSCLYLLYKDRSHLPGIIIMAALWGAGPGIDGRFLLDEFLICLSILFVLLTSWRDFWQRFFRLRTQLTWWDAPLLAFCVYFALQGGRTALVMDSPAVLLAGAMNIYVAGIYLVLRMYDVQAYCAHIFTFNWRGHVRTRSFADLIIFAVILYDAVYIFQGMFAEQVLGVVYTSAPGALGRFANQGISWSGSAYAIMPNLIGLYVGAWRFPRHYTQFFILVGLQLLTALTYDSRIALLMFAVGGAIVLWRLQLKMFRTGIPILMITLALCAYVRMASVSVEDTIYSTVKSTTFLVTPTVDEASHGAGGDYDRYLHFYAGFQAIDDSLPDWAFGHGLMTHRLFVGPAVLELLRNDPRLSGYEDSSTIQHFKNAMDNTIPESEKPVYQRSLLFSGPRTTTFTAVTIDGGLVGLALLYASLLSAFLYCTRHVWKLSLHNHRLGASVMIFVLLAAWPVVIYLVGSTLYWLMLMPAAMAAVLPDETNA